MRFRFNDKKSQRQVNHFYTHRNCTQNQNAQGLVEYQIKRARLVGSRGEWELADSIQT